MMTTFEANYCHIPKGAATAAAYNYTTVDFSVFHLCSTNSVINVPFQSMVTVV